MLISVSLHALVALLELCVFLTVLFRWEDNFDGHILIWQTSIVV